MKHLIYHNIDNEWISYWLSCNGLLCVVKDNLNHNQSSENVADEGQRVDMPLTAPGGSVAGGGTRAGLFRTPISGGVQSATSAHDLPRPALAVRNLMEQVNICYYFVLRYYSLL